MPGRVRPVGGIPVLLPGPVRVVLSTPVLIPQARTHHGERTAICPKTRHDRPATWVFRNPSWGREAVEKLVESTSS